MKDFEITVCLKGNELIISETDTTSVIKSFVYNQGDVIRCIKNYTEVYFKNYNLERKEVL